MAIFVPSQIINIFVEWCDQNDVPYDDGDIGQWLNELEIVLESG